MGRKGSALALGQPLPASGLQPQWEGTEGIMCPSRGSPLRGQGPRHIPSGGAAGVRGLGTHLLNVVVEASDGKAGVIVILSDPLWVLLRGSGPG